MRVAAWRGRHRAQAGRVREYRVEHDGSVIASLTARTASTLDDELAAAAWELAQGLSRPATVDVLALSEEGAEVARLPLRVVPAASASSASSGDLRDVVRALLDANHQQQKLMVEVLGAVGGQLRDALQLASEATRAAHARAASAEAEAASASAVVREALDLARTAQTPERGARERGMDLVEGVLRDLARSQLGGGGAPAAAAVESAPAAEPEAAQ